ncbi:hypothetical protein [Delftia sp. WSY_11]|uniref:hypothetical protein n=1 Tax=Delftia sp. WSY_11 TaxID=3367205 RepID=UPI00370D6DDA
MPIRWPKPGLTAALPNRLKNTQAQSRIKIGADCCGKGMIFRVNRLATTTRAAIEKSRNHLI